MLILVAGVVDERPAGVRDLHGIAWLASPYVGLRFYEVQPDSPARRAGLQPGEAIVAIDGERYQFITGPTR
jgi:C-terminal processing protease CtpA/Prc